MDMPSMNLLTISPIYLALLGILFIPFTMRVGAYRMKNKVNLGDGGDPELIKRIRGQGNFVETVPLAILLIVVMEVLGAGDMWLHGLGTALVAGRFLHYLGVTDLGPFVCRPIGMFATLAVYLVAPVWILVAVL